MTKTKQWTPHRVRGGRLIAELSRGKKSRTEKLCQDTWLGLEVAERWSSNKHYSGKLLTAEIIIVKVTLVTTFCLSEGTII